MRNVTLYRHVRLDKNEVFYVGIGRGDRAYDKKPYNRSKWWHRIISKTDYRVDILFDDLTWEEACEKEKEFISLYGRKNIGTGTLCNMTDGGAGGDTLTGNPNLSIIASKISKANKGRKFTKDHKHKLALAKNPIQIIQLDSTGNIIREWESLSQIRRELGFTTGIISNCCQGKREIYKGFKWKYKQ